MRYEVGGDMNEVLSVLGWVWTYAHPPSGWQPGRGARGGPAWGDRRRHLGFPRDYLSAPGQALLRNEVIRSAEQVALAGPSQVFGPRDRAGLDCCPLVGESWAQKG